MSRWPDRLVRLAALTLPPTIRNRYREEWRADVAAATSAGVRPASIAVGALVFSATLDRDAPEISGAPIPVIARYHARWALALIGVAGVLMISGYLSGNGVSDRDSNMTVALLVAAAGTTWTLLSLLCSVIGIVELWRAARLSSGLARISAALGTVGFAVLVASFLWRELSTIAGLAVPLLLAALICGSIAWGSASLPGTAVPRPGRMGTTGADAARTAVAVASLVLIAVVAFGTLELVVLSPTWMAPGYSVEEIYAALSDGDRGTGIAMILIWTVFWGLAALAYPVVGLTLAKRLGPDGPRWAVLTALTLIAAMVFCHFLAGFSIGNSISDTLPPMAGGISEYGRLLRVIGQAALVIAVVGWIAPRRQAAATTPSSASPY